jgi:outer membrane protein insertion porin family
MLGFTVAAALAAPEDYEGRLVKAVEFSPDRQPYPRSYLEEILAVKAGQTLHLTAVRAAIERLYRTGRYADIKVDARSEDGGVTLRFLTRDNFFIGRVRVSGAPQPPNEGVLANATRLELGTLFTEEATRQAVSNLELILRSNGLYETTVKPELAYDSDTEQVNVGFVVAAGKRARYMAPNITGKPERPAQDIVKTTHWKGWFGWKDVTEARTQDALQRVRSFYQKQDRLEARVRLERMDYEKDTNRVRPAFDVEAGPKIRVITVGAKISRGRLKQMVPVFEEQSVDRDLLVEGRNNIREYLESQGYFDAKVDFVSRSPNGGAETIEYRVERGPRHKIVLVSFRGNKAFDTVTLRERMYIRPASLIQFPHGRFSEAFLRHDVGAIEDLYRSNGFRDVVVTPRVQDNYGGKWANMAVSFAIHEGPQWLVENLEVDGPSQKNRPAIQNLIQSLSGQPFSEANVAIDRDNILDHYYNEGHAGATFTWSFTPAGEPHRVNLKYVIEEGPQRYLRRFLLTGLDTTDPRLVEERLMLSPGEPLSRSRLLDTQRRLYDLGIFARVDMALQNPQGEERDKYVGLDTEEAGRYTITTGFGAEFAKIGGCQTCLDAPAGQAGFSPRASLGVTRRNFLGTGHIISLQTRISTLEQRGVLSYQAPQFRGNPDVNLLFSALYDDSRDVRTFSARRREGSVQVGQRVSRASTLLYRFSYRRVSATDLKINALLLPLFSQPARIGISAINYVEDRRDDPTDSHRGTFNTLDLGWASKYFGSQSDFTHFIGHNSTYHPFGLGSRYVLARSLTFGFLGSLRNSEIPLPERIFGGGANSHRGFPEFQAGQRDPVSGFPIGGKAVLLNQIELRYPMMGDNLTGVLFEDAGNFYSELKNVSFRVRQRGMTDFDYMVHAVGFGIRYRTPVGPVRLDLAWSINPPQFRGFKGTINELLVCSAPNSPAPCVTTVQQISHFQFHFSLGQAF